jgi:hypothetical protein
MLVEYGFVWYSDDKVNVYPTIFEWQWMLRDAFAAVRAPIWEPVIHNPLPMRNILWVWPGTSLLDANPYPATTVQTTGFSAPSYHPPSTLGDRRRGCVRNRSEFGARRELRCHRSSAMGNGSMLTPAHHEASSP